MDQKLIVVYFTFSIINLIHISSCIKGNEWRMVNLVQELNIEKFLLMEIMEEIVDFVCLKDGEGKWIRMNSNSSNKNLLQLDYLYFLGKKDNDLARLYPNFQVFFENCRISDEETWLNGKITKFEESVYNIEDEMRIFDIIKVPFFNVDGSRNELLILGRDITNEKKNETDLEIKIKELEDFKFALDESSIVAITDHRGIITYVNNKFCEISKYSKNELIGNNHRIVNSGYHPKSFMKSMWKTIQDGRVWMGNIKNKAKDGSNYWVKTTIIPFVDNKGIPYQYISIRQDITEQMKMEEQILYNSYHDELTGLRNRRYLKDNLNQWINENKNNQMALLFLDLNRFKFINDTLGHSVGDQVLREVSNRIFTYLHEKAELYRFGGDEFIIALKNCTINDVNELANEINHLLSPSFHINDESLYLSASVGISLFPSDGVDIETLVKKADSAMYVAKKKGMNSIQFYSSKMYEDMNKTMNLERALRQAVEEKDFILHYQPQIDLSSNKIIGVEALIRWKHPVTGNISPSEFIPLAEETGLITPITKWVLETACKQNKKWQENGTLPIRIGVNISPYLFREDLIEMVKRILNETQLQPCYLELEITESLMQDPTFTIPILKELKSLGVRLSIDDFGTGYSSLAYLRHFPIDSLKIDRSFINDIQTDNGVMVKAIIDMASHLSVSVIAEGIENQEQLYFLSKLNCSEGQGYYFSRPLPSSEINKILPKFEKVGEQR
ncbi:EAL domain-containing protein (plasmid) [Peribacillus sp. JNUCC 23]